jgi:hypothetical protein
MNDDAALVCAVLSPLASGTPGPDATPTLAPVVCPNWPFS